MSWAWNTISFVVVLWLLLALCGLLGLLVVDWFLMVFEISPGASLLWAGILGQLTNRSLCEGRSRRVQGVVLWSVLFCVCLDNRPALWESTQVDKKLQKLQNSGFFCAKTRRTDAIFNKIKKVENSESPCWRVAQIVFFLEIHDILWPLLGVTATFHFFEKT